MGAIHRSLEISICGHLNEIRIPDMVNMTLVLKAEFDVTPPSDLIHENLRLIATSGTLPSRLSDSGALQPS